MVALFQHRLGYRYLGNWIDRDNSHIDQPLRRAWLQARGVVDTLINRALHEFTKVAGDSSKSLYDRNRAMYEMLRYGIKVPPGAGENRVAVRLIDWHPPRQRLLCGQKGHGQRLGSSEPDAGGA